MTIDDLESSTKAPATTIGDEEGDDDRETLKTPRGKQIHLSHDRNKATQKESTIFNAKVA